MIFMGPLKSIQADNTKAFGIIPNSLARLNKLLGSKIYVSQKIWD
jgi:hypothetical protein